VCHDVIGPDCYGMFGKGFDTLVATPFNVTLHDTDCVSCGALCPGRPNWIADDGRTLSYRAILLRWTAVSSAATASGMPHGALGETPNFELSFFDRFGDDVTLEKEDLANAPNYLVRQRLPRGEGAAMIARWRDHYPPVYSRVGVDVHSDNLHCAHFPLTAADGLGADVHPWPPGQWPLSANTRMKRDAMKFDRAQ